MGLADSLLSRRRLERLQIQPFALLPWVALAALLPALAACGSTDGADASSGDGASSVEGDPLSSPTGACFSGTLGREVPRASCVLSKFDKRWYQCRAGRWVDRWTDPDACVFPSVIATPPSPGGTDVGAVPFHHGPDVGFGVGFKEVPGATGENAFIGYAGYGITQGAAEAWVDEMYRRVLAPRGVRYLYAVGGPNEPGYANAEIGNSRVAASLVRHVSPRTQFIVVAGHSSGAFVANELVNELASGADPRGMTAGKVVYFNLEGDPRGLGAASVSRLRKLYFVSAHDGGLRAPNFGAMEAGGAEFRGHGGFFSVDASQSGCSASWCVHVSLIISRPHEAWGADRANDYSNFAGHPLEHRWLDEKASEAGLW